MVSLGRVGCMCRCGRMTQLVEWRGPRAIEGCVCVCGCVWFVLHMCGMFRFAGNGPDTDQPRMFVGRWAGAVYVSLCL